MCIQGYDKITHKIQKTQYQFLKKKNAKTRRTVFRVNFCFKVSIVLFLLVIIKIKFIWLFIDLLIFFNVIPT
jgi:hypothetical protein